MRIDAGHPCIAGCGAFRAPRNAQTTPDEDSIRTRSAPQQHGAAGTQSTCRLRSPGTAVSSPRAGAGSQASALGPRDPDFRRLRCPVAGSHCLSRDHRGGQSSPATSCPTGMEAQPLGPVVSSRILSIRIQWRLYTMHTWDGFHQLFKQTPFLPSLFQLPSR